MFSFVHTDFYNYYLSKASLKGSKLDDKKILKMSDLVVFSRKGFDTKAKKSAIIKHLKSRNINFFK